MDELADLYKDGTGSRKMTPLLKTTGWFVWSGETKGSSAARDFDLYHGGYSSWAIGGSSSNGKRAFAVRSRGDG